jgi:choline transport protein
VLDSWSSTIGWQAGMASGMLLVGSSIQMSIIVARETYVPTAWQSTLLALAAVVMAFVGNVYGSRILPYWQNAIFAIHIMAFLGYIIPIWVSAPMATNEEVWGQFDASGGWSSMGLTIMVGQLTGIANALGIDAVCISRLRAERARPC